MPTSLSQAYGVSCRARAERVRYGRCRFAPRGTFAPRMLGSPARTCVKARLGRFNVRPVPDWARIKHYWVGRSLSCLAELAGALQVLADLAHVPGGAVGALGDHAVGLIGAAAKRELEHGR